MNKIIKLSEIDLKRITEDVVKSLQQIRDEEKEMDVKLFGVFYEKDEKKFLNMFNYQKSPHRWPVAVLSTEIGYPKKIESSDSEEQMYDVTTGTIYIPLVLVNVRYTTKFTHLQFSPSENFKPRWDNSDIPMEVKKQISNEIASQPAIYGLAKWLNKKNDSGSAFDRIFTTLRNLVKDYEPVE